MGEMTWRGRSVFVTGGNGFLGAHLVRRLVDAGANVTCLVYCTTALQPSPAGARIVSGDVQDFDLLCDILREDRVDTIFHLAAQPIVIGAQANPLPTLETNVAGTYRLLEAARRWGKARSLVIATCYDDKTRTVTPNGFKRFDELKAGDTVFSLNASGEMVETAIEEVVVQDYVGPMVKFDGASIDLLVTPNHRMIVEKLNNKDQTHRDIFIEAATKVPTSGWKIPNGEWCGVDKKIVITGIPHWNANKLQDDIADEDILYLLGIYIGDGCVQRQVVGDVTTVTAKEFIARPRNSKGHFEPLPKELKPIGRRARSRSNVVFLYIPYKDKARVRVEATLDRMRIKWSDWKHGGEGAIFFSSSQLCDLFEQAGKIVYEKRIPRWVMDLPPMKLRYVLDGILDSDGCASRQVVTSSWRLVQDLVELVTKCGMCVAYSKRKPPKKWPMIKGRRIVARDAWDVFLSRRNGESRSIWPKMQSTQHYEGKVWCLRVPPHGNFLVEREGRVMFCGNSDKVYGDSPRLPYVETHPLDGRGLYDATKVCQDVLAQSYARCFEMPIGIARCGNLYGPGDAQWSRIIPGTIKSLLAGERPVIRGDGKSKRDYFYVEDAADAFLALGAALSVAGDADWMRGGAYNFGTGVPTSTLEVVEKIVALSGAELPPMVLGGAKGEIGEQYLDCAKAHNDLGWRPRVSLDEGLTRTLDWYKKALCP